MIQFEALSTEAELEGFHMVTRLISEWCSGTHRYESEAEPLISVSFQGRIVAVGGITLQTEGVGRVRRVYVSREFRRKGVGRLLVEELVRLGKPHYSLLVLNTESDQASHFYERLGFSRLKGENPYGATHSIRLT